MGGKKRLRISLLGFALLLVAIAVIYVCIPKEPRYQGRALSSWISNHLNSHHNFPGSTEWRDASNAVVQIGTNGLPWLVKWATAKDSKTASAIKSRINSYLPYRYRFLTDLQRQRNAILGFQCLGPAGKSLWPVFVEWTHDNDSSRRLIGLDCLIATTADRKTLFPVLARLIKDSDGRIRAAALLCFNVLYPQNPDASDVDNRFPMSGNGYQVKPNELRYLIF